MNNCIFCKIIQGEIPCYKVWEDEYFLVILDAFPSVLGQVLVLPKKHSVDCLFDLDEVDYRSILIVAKKAAEAIQSALNPIKVGMVVEGLEIAHVHLKLYPLDKRGLVLKPALKKLSGLEMKDIAKKISDAF